MENGTVVRRLQRKQQSETALSRSSSIALILLAAATAAAMLLRRPDGDACTVHWRVGDIDARFDISAFDVVNAASNAAAAWNAAAGRRVLWYDKTNGIPLNLVFDTNQPAMAANIALVREIRRLSAQIDALQPEYDANPSADLAERINGAIRRYNELVDRYNSTPQKEIRQGSYARQLDIYAFADTLDLRIVIAHEFGHALGIDHVPGPDAVMKARSTIGTDSTFRLREADVAALKKACAL